ncbi:restriction endonuclease subunit S [Streptomyces phytohabitans]|uniref:restriction endonuclease subunit S n=1 Tax=Streptomyces phytohabitans TaxID=1150371 RepID=UPI00345C343A
MSESITGIRGASGWAEMPLSNVTELLRRGTAPLYVSNSRVRVIGQRCVQSSGFHAEVARPHDPAVTSRSLIAEQGDVLLNSTGRGTIGRSCLFDAEEVFAVDSHVTVLRAKRDLVDPRWIDLVLRSPRGQSYLESHCFVGSTNQVELSRGELADMRIPVPPLVEQRKIVDAIDAVSAQEHAIDKEIAKLRSVRQGILLASMESVSGSHMPTGWTRIPLREVVPLVEYGISEAFDQDPRGLPVLRMNNLRDGKAELSELRYSPTPVPRRLELRYGDVLFNRTNSIEHIGKSGLWRDELVRATYASYLVRINPEPSRLIPEYLVEWLMHPVIRQRVRSISTVAVQQVNVNPSRLRELDIDMPVSLGEQRRLIDSLGSCDRQIDQGRVELTKLRKLKRGIVDNFLSWRA